MDIDQEIKNYKLAKAFPDMNCEKRNSYWIETGKDENGKKTGYWSHESPYLVELDKGHY